MNTFLDIEDYLEYVGRFRNSAFGQRYRSQFRDLSGTAELAMLKSPSKDEYEDFCRAVNMMTLEEKLNPEKLSDEQIHDIAERADADCGNISIFINGFILARRESEQRQH